LTATERVGYHQYRYEKTDNAHILVDLGYHINWDKPTDTYIKQVNDSTLLVIAFQQDGQLTKNCILRSELPTDTKSKIFRR
jgi:putative alpha-1,2-mannosidase